MWAVGPPTPDVIPAQAGIQTLRGQKTVASLA
jgi:hypothetical protein